MARLAIILLLMLAAVSFCELRQAAAQEIDDMGGCELYRITGYVRGHHSARTFDGTSVWTREPIAAASWNIPIGARVQVENVGTFRVADRGGGLGARHVDVLVDSLAEAYQLTRWARVCVLL